MKKLFLASQFNLVDSLVGKFFSGLDLSTIQIAYVPNADPSKEPKERSSYKSLTSLNFKIIITDIEKMTFDEIKNIFNECQAIFVAGGDPVYLVNKLRENEVDKLLIQEIEKGKFYLGSSAGSMIVGDKIKTSEYLSKKTELGLGLLNLSILPHWGRENDLDYRDKKVQLIQECYNEKLSIVTLTDDQIIVVEGEKIEIWNK